MTGPFVAHGFAGSGSDKVLKVTSVDEILVRHEQPINAEEFDRIFGSLPSDDEG